MNIEMEQLVYLILTDLYDFFIIGFGVFSLVRTLLNIYKENICKGIDLTAIQIVRIFGLLFITVLLYDTYNKIYGIRYEQDTFPYTNLITTEYWYAYWLKLIIVILLISTLWNRKIRDLQTFRFLSSIILLIPYTVLIKFIIVSISKRHDYLPSSWTFYTPLTSYIVGYLIYGIGFTLLTILIHQIKLRIAR